ncbi:hypothetical protein LTR62_008131 [Meristemomyces frigidus]|uniref:Uncharacterized protein n=1 Tax=Meristemomyces frigidus TaxID=1508187 RepID=A0AAN7T9W9_9PEZI|nr:hypothetical protein LTR62_008131 [Meristemomyces frigidus]
MATKTKDKPIAQKIPKKASSKKQFLPKTSHKSQELVMDSEDEDEAASERDVKKVVAQPALVQQSATESSEESGTDSESSIASATIAKPGPKPPAKTTIAKVNGIKRTASDVSGTEDESANDESLPDAPATKRQKAEIVGLPEAEQTTKSKSKTKNYSSATAPAPISGIVEQAGDTAPIPPQVFEPPPGYVTADVADATSSGIFDAASLAGKQIWQITAPANLPLSSLHTISIDALHKGKSLLHQEGVDYTIAEDTDDTSTTTVLIRKEGTYGRVQQKPTRQMRIQERVIIPNLSIRQTKQSTGSAAAAEVARSAVSSIRPQPHGLRMRFQPLGVKGSAEVGWESDEALEDDAPVRGSAVQFPQAVGGAHDESERKDEHTGGSTAPVNGSTQKPKKKRKDKTQRSETEHHPKINGTSKSAPTSVDQTHEHGAATTIAATPVQKIVAPEVDDSDTTMTGLEDGMAKESKEERARRKEEKRLRKEARVKGKAA